MASPSGPKERLILDGFRLSHVAHGINPIRLTEKRPDAGDLMSDPELWREVYFQHRDEVLRAHGPDCEAARRFEPDLLEEDLDDDCDDGSDDDFSNPEGTNDE